MTTTMQQFGPYLLGELLGRGGMGEVHRATDTTQDNRVVALKLLAPHLSADEAYRARFRRECETAARLDDPHVVPIHRYGEIDGRLFLDMQLVDGRDLAAELTEAGTLHPARAVGIVMQVAAALDAAHRAGLVHRDVKPSNILLTAPAPGRPDFALLADFGIVAAAGPDGGGGADGTVEYLAPERLLGAPADHRADVYALTCVLYELLTGLRAFPGADFAAQVHGHLYLPPPRPTETIAGLPPALDQVIARGMAKNPGHRYSSAGALADDALAALRPGPAAVDSPAATGTPRLSRRRLLVGAASAVVLSGGGALAVALRGSGAQPGPGPAAAPTIAPQEPVIAERALSVRSTNPYPFRTTQVNGLPAIIVSGHSRVMQLHDLTTDRAIEMPLIHSLDVEDVEVADVDSRPIVLAAARTDGGGSDSGGEISAFELQTPARMPVGAHGAYVDGLTAATAGGRPIAATIGGELMRRWDLRTGAPLGPPMPAQGLLGRVSMSTFVVEGRAHLVADGGFVMYVWDLETGEQVAQPLAVGGITELDGAPVVVSARRGLVVTDLHSGAEVRRHDGPPAKLSVVAVVDGRPVVVTDGEQNTIVIRDVDTGQQLGAPLVGHQAELTRLGVADLHGRPVLVSAANDNAIRVWDLAVRAAG
jgi:hypothetical protein